jgi:4-amino-4-deoxy-L-arabinose transferase-like glycosyltransferase
MNFATPELFKLRTFMLSNRYILFVLFALGLALRIVVSMNTTVQIQPLPVLSSHGILASPDFLSGQIAALAHRAPMMTQLLGVLADLATAILLFSLSQIRFGRRVAPMISGFYLLVPASLYESSADLIGTLLCCGVALLLFLYDRLERSEWSGPLSAITGFTLGLLVLLRENMLLLVAALLIYIVLIRYETSRRTRIASASVILATVLLIILPVLVHKAVTTGYFALNSYSGWSVYIGNNPYADGSESLSALAADSIMTARRTPNEQDALALHDALDYITLHRHEAAELWPRKFAELWKAGLAPEGGTDSSAIGAAYLGFGLRLLCSVPYMLLILAATAGFFLYPHWPARGLLILILFLFGCLALFTYGDPADHHALLPCLLLSAGALLRYHAWKTVPEWRRTFFLVSAGLFVGIWLHEWLDVLGWVA